MSREVIELKDIYKRFYIGTPNELEDEYDYEEALEFHYMYYDFVIYRLERRR